MDSNYTCTRRRSGLIVALDSDKTRIPVLSRRRVAATDGTRIVSPTTIHLSTSTPMSPSK